MLCTANRAMHQDIDYTHVSHNDVVSNLQTYGTYPLHRAAESGNLNLLKSLLELGCSADETNYDYQTPLHVACNHGHAECAELLLACGSKVNAITIDGGTPLCDACSCGSIECVRILLSHKALVNPPLSLTTPLHEACLKGSLDCVTILVNAGAHLDVNDCNFGTPLHAAAFMNRPDCIRMLLQAGASVNAIKIHQTPLHIAATNNYYEVGMVLLEFGANVFASNNQNKTPLELLPERDGPFFEMLLHHIISPTTLKDICRRVIRHSIGARRMQLIGNLRLPKSLLSYIMHIV